MSCSCGSNCSCGSSCNCGKRYLDLSDEKITTTQTAIVGFAVAKSEFGGVEMADEVAENGCKCGSNCTCTNCGLKTIFLIYDRSFREQNAKKKAINSINESLRFLPSRPPLDLFPSLSSARHVITLRTSVRLQPSTLAWDPISQHFVVGSATDTTVYAVSDAGVVEHLISDRSAAGADGIATSLAVDYPRRRLIVAYSNPGFVAAYDLKSYGRIFAAPLPEMDTVPGGVAVDLRSGEAFVTSTKRGVVWKVGLEGKVGLISASKIFGDQALGGVVHVSRGYLLIVQPETGKIFKVDSDDGAVKEVLSPRSSKPLAPASHSIALHPDLSVIIATNQSLLLVKSDDSWSKAALHDKSELGEKAAIAVAIRERKRAYVLVKSHEGYRIEEVEWEKESEGDMVWGFVFLGIALAFLMYWRFQIGKLASNMNKKRN